jgi:diamine N-acetyltransferase
MVSIQKVTIADADALRAFSKKTFYEFFAHLNTPENMEAYSAVAFTPEKIHTELSNPDSEFYFAIVDNEIGGYMKLNFGNAQTEPQSNDTLEIERIYVSGEHHGKKIGKLLLNFAIDIALNKQFGYIWLGVWEHNKQAIGFYEHSGFKPFGSHDFFLGDDRQVDLLMRKEL